MPLLKNKLFKLAKDGNCFLIVGTPSLNKEGKEFNSIFVISPKGEVVGQYNKQHLVPFEENCFSTGEESNVIEAGEARLGLNICFESIYPYFARVFFQKDANLLIIATNDAGFKRTLLVNLHTAYAVFRAVENRTYVVRAAQSGISLIVDPFGRIIRESKTFEQIILNGSVGLRRTETFYTKYGDVFSYLCSIVFLVTLILSSKKVVSNV